MGVVTRAKEIGRSVPMSPGTPPQFTPCSAWLPYPPVWACAAWQRPCSLAPVCCRRCYTPAPRPPRAAGTAAGTDPRSADAAHVERRWLAGHAKDTQPHRTVAPHVATVTPLPLPQHHHPGSTLCERPLDVRRTRGGQCGGWCLEGGFWRCLAHPPRSRHVSGNTGACSAPPYLPPPPPPYPPCAFHQREDQ